LGIVRQADAPAQGDFHGRIARMTQTLVHRGPDAGGLWIDDRQRIGLGYRRLAVIDPSAAGNQPFHSPSGRYVLIYNGELYNHRDLRARLNAEQGSIVWCGRSDTETLALAIDIWGLETTLERIEGMFAFACWDRAEDRLVLARDRLGEKPLFYGWVGSGVAAEFVFASEPKAFLVHPSFERRIDRHSLALFMRHGHVPAPHSIYENIAKLPAGCTATLALGSERVQLRTYWSVRERLVSGQVPVRRGDGGAGELESLLRTVVRQEMAADVPVGAFLSGGVDSSTIVALMQQESGTPVRTFALGFEEREFNEAPHARAVANHLGTDHQDLIVTAADAAEVLPLLPSVYDEPFADPSAIPTLLLSGFAREKVTVALSGDGADELFGGYNVYGLATAFAPLIRIPRPIRAPLAASLAWLSAPRWSSNRLLGPILNGRLAHKLSRSADVLRSDSAAEVYGRLTAAWRAPEELVVGAGPLPPSQELAFVELAGVGRMMAVDLTSYLPDHILVKVDRAAMHHSLETRMPYLHPAIVDYALGAGVPGRGQGSKELLRQILGKYVPSALTDRPKQGFGIPLAQWLRGPLRDWAEALLDADRLYREGLLHPEPVRRVWQSHLAGRNEQNRLWPILMFQSWLANVHGRVESDLAPDRPPVPVEAWQR
jgi:asparagine synthase (glutamine-hydrolysing)